MQIAFPPQRQASCHIFQAQFFSDCHVHGVSEVHRANWQVLSNGLIAAIRAKQAEVAARSSIGRSQTARNLEIC